MQSVYNLSIVGLSFMPKKTVAVSTAAILSCAALYIIKPETLSSQIAVITISSISSWTVTVATHKTANKLLENILDKAFKNDKEPLIITEEQKDINARYAEKYLAELND